MAQLSYSFCMSLLHSLWQAGILVLLYRLAEIGLQQKFTPLQKKNLLFVSLAVQAALMSCTFFIYYFDTENDLASSIIIQTINNVLSADIIHAFTPWFFALYLITVTYKITKTVYEWHTFRSRFSAGIQKPFVDLKLFTALKANHFGIKRKVQLWFSNTIDTPLTFGFFKPVIVLPIALVNRLSMPQTEALILHELTHIKCNDYLLNWFLILAENIFFFNPFVLSLCKKIHLEREKYCDISVMAFDYAPLTYAETLLQAQQVKQYFSRNQLAAVGKKQELLQRIQFFTNAKNHISQRKHHLTFPLLALLLTAMITGTLFFQYTFTRTKKPAATAAIVPANLPASELTAPVFVNNIIESLTDKNLKAIAAAVEKQQPVIEKQIKKLAPLIKEIQNNAATIAEDMGDNLITPVAFQENDATRQIVVREEQSGSKNATVKVYTLSFINGKWIIKPEWMMAAKEVMGDSLHINLTDSSLINDKEE